MDDRIRDLGAQYDAEYYAHSLGQPYRRGEPAWEKFFGRIADEIVTRLNPESVLDVGCAIGLLVEALRERGVDARGIDVSEYALSQAPDWLQPHVRLKSIMDDLEGPYDLVVCIEVLEHLPAAVEGAAVANLARASDTILFSSSPSDFDEPTHQNVRPVEYWLTSFAAHGLTRYAGLDPSVVSQQALLLRRQPDGLVGVVSEYERWHAEQVGRLAARRERDDRDERRGSRRRLRLRS